MADLADVIQSKEAARRPKDLRVLPALTATCCHAGRRRPSLGQRLDAFEQRNCELEEQNQKLQEQNRHLERRLQRLEALACARQP